MADEPNFDAFVDKGFGLPPQAEADNSTPEPAPEPPADTPSQAPTDNDQGVDASVILMREDYSRKMHKLGEERRQIEAERARLAALQELSDRLDTDETFRSQFESAWQNAQSGQANGPAPVGDHALRSRIDRLERTLAQQSQQAHFDAVDQAAQRVAAEFKLSKKDTEDVVQRAVRAGTLHPNVSNAALYDVLAMSAALHVLPRAAANGQRELLDQMKDRGRQATPVAERAAPAEPEPDVTKMSQRDYENYLISNANKVTARR